MFHFHYYTSLVFQILLPVFAKKSTKSYAAFPIEPIPYSLGKLEYRSLKFDTKILDQANYQGNAVVNYTDRETPYTRIIEHKHFEFGTQSKTVVSKEYSSEWKLGDEPYYPVNDEKNTLLYRKYEEKKKENPRIIFGGRLGRYQYYDMDKAVEITMKIVREELGNE